ncbi:hypothetical protein scyTo_0023921, partial [Scyliorhinus torazame]|nr:hypothetical protein [Scyliorhinus torazame]
IQVAAEEGILRAVSSDTSLGVKQYCIMYNSQWMPIPKSLNSATKYQLKDLTNTNLCNSTDVPPEGIKDNLVVVKRGNCTFIRKAQIAQKNFAKALLVASVDSIFPPSDNESDYQKLTIPVALILYDDVLSMKKVNLSSVPDCNKAERVQLTTCEIKCLVFYLKGWLIPP